MKRIAILTLVIVAIADPIQGHANKMNVVTTSTMVTDMVKSVGGSRVIVVGLMGPGVDHHLYNPSSGDVVKLHNEMPEGSTLSLDKKKITKESYLLCWILEPDCSLRQGAVGTEFAHFGSRTCFLR